MCVGAESLKKLQDSSPITLNVFFYCYWKESKMWIHFPSSATMWLAWGCSFFQSWSDITTLWLSAHSSSSLKHMQTRPSSIIMSCNSLKPSTYFSYDFTCLHTCVRGIFWALITEALMWWGHMAWHSLSSKQCHWCGSSYLNLPLSLFLRPTQTHPAGLID